MTPTPLIPWADLLSKHWSNVNDEYGPNSQEVASALVALDKSRWLEEVGKPWQDCAGGAPGSVTIVRSWDEALTIFGEELRYNANGVLEAPCARVDPVLERFPERKAWWQKAREQAKRYTAFSAWIPDHLPQEQQDLLYENLWEYVSMLLVEIIVSPEAGCTYFRGQLPWFHAGHFPCGWDGDWPSGRMRIY
jgi:hypothetical protein